MKKTLCGSFMLGLLMATTSAFATGVDNSALTTKGYVDAGLTYVHNEIQNAIGDGTTSGLLKDVSDLQTAVGDGTTSGLLKDVSDLQTAVGDGTTSGLLKDVSDLQTDVQTNTTAIGTAASGGNAGTGLTGRVETLEGQIQNLPSALQSGDGVTISNGTASITGLDSTTETDGKIYILKNNQAEELPIADTWDNNNLPWNQQSGGAGAGGGN